MTTRIRRGAAGSIAGILLVSGLTACGGDPEVKQSDVEKQIESRLKSTGVKVEDVDCEDGLKAKVGAEVKCEAKVDGSKQKMKAVVKSVNGNTVNYTVEKD